jgi:hypothetical protein
MSHKVTKLLVTGVLTCSLTSLAHATAAGFYFGLQAGRTNQHNTQVTLQTGGPPPTGTTTVNPSNTGVGGRLFMGYNYSKYFAVEMGFTHYAPTTYNIPTTPTLTVGNPFGTPNGSPAINENGFDFDGKGMLPIGNSGFGALGKAGVAIIKRGMAGSLSQSYNAATNSIVTSSTANTTNFRPTAAIGFYYDFTQSFEADFTVSRVFGGGNMKNADLYALGISYHAVDRYCGQFLC